MKQIKQMSRYQIYWIILQPIVRRPTKKDLNLINRINKPNRFVNTYVLLYTFTQNKEKAKQILNSLKSISPKLSKRYRGFIITNAQFERADVNKYWEVATSKQKEESIIL